MTPVTTCQSGKGKNEAGECVDCPPGYFSANGDTCEKCTICEMSRPYVRDCSTTKDRVCDCADGEFWDLKQCKNCTLCHPGYYQQRDCKNNRDRYCHPCPPGEDTNAYNAKKCFPRQKPSEPVATSEMQETLRVPVIISLVFALAFVLVIFFFILKRRKRNFNNAAPRRVEDEKVGENIPLQYVDIVSLPLEDYEDRLLSDNGENKLRYVRDLSAFTIEELALKLNPERPYNWVALASRLNYSVDHIGIFKLNPANATQNLLSSWSTTEHSTVLNLYNTLIRICRDDAARIIERYVYVDET